MTYLKKKLEILQKNDVQKNLSMSFSVSYKLL